MLKCKVLPERRRFHAEDLSAEEAPQKERARFHEEDVHEERPQGIGSPQK
jgi:hypothetical protein